MGETRPPRLLCGCLLIAVDELTKQDRAEDPLLAEQALAWMRARLEDEFTVPDLAAACGLKASRFHEAFHAAAGEAPAAAMRQLRREEAAARFSRGDESIDRITKRLHVASAWHLFIWFRRFHGRTPAALRMEKRTARESIFFSRALISCHRITSLLRTDGGLAPLRAIAIFTAVVRRQS